MICIIWFHVISFDSIWFHLIPWQQRLHCLLRLWEKCDIPICEITCNRFFSLLDETWIKSLYPSFLCAPMATKPHCHIAKRLETWPKSSVVPVSFLHVHPWPEILNLDQEPCSDCTLLSSRARTQARPWQRHLVAALPGVCWGQPQDAGGSQSHPKLKNSILTWGVWILWCDISNLTNFPGSCLPHVRRWGGGGWQTGHSWHWSGEAEILMHK